MARDRGFRKVVARDLIKTSARRVHSAKARVTGLEPHEQYYYRFATRDEESPVGRFRTALPPDSHQPVRFAFFSCQDFTFGYFNAHALLAKEDVDFVVNLGDYIYAEAYHSAGSPTGGVRTDPVGIVGDARSVPRQVRASTAPTRACGAMHAQFPMISIWDDHEVQDNYAGGAGPTAASTRPSRYSDARKEAGYRAYFESMPTFGAKRGSAADLPRAALRPQRGPDAAATSASTATTSPAATPCSARPARSSTTRASTSGRAR